MCLSEQQKSEQLSEDFTGNNIPFQWDLLGACTTLHTCSGPVE